MEGLVFFLADLWHYRRLHLPGQGASRFVWIPGWLCFGTVGDRICRISQPAPG
jgi:hypothetical protein